MNLYSARFKQSSSALEQGGHMSAGKFCSGRFLLRVKCTYFDIVNKLWGARDKMIYQYFKNVGNPRHFFRHSLTNNDMNKKIHYF